jgi:hypothetical protein
VLRTGSADSENQDEHGYERDHAPEQIPIHRYFSLIS